MKKTFWSIILLVISILALVAGILSFVALFYEMPKVTDTKLQIFTFQHYENKTIYCSDKQQVNIPLAAYTYFDEQAFLNEIQVGDDFLVRVLSTELSEKNENFTAFAIIFQNSHYLTLEDVSLAFGKQNGLAYICLTVGILFFMLLVTVIIFLWATRKRNN